MAIGTPVARGNGTGTTSAVTGSFTPTASSVLIATVFARQNTTVPAQPTISDSAGLTWTQINDTSFDPGANPRSRGRMFWAQVGGSPASMTVTGTVAAAANTFIIVDEYTGAGTSDFTNNIGATNGAGDPTVTLPSAPAATSGFHIHSWFGANNTITSAAGFTELLDAQAGATTNRLYSAYDITTPPTSAAITSTNPSCIAIGVEIKEAASGTTVTVSPATMIYAGQSVTVNARINVGVTVGIMAYTGQAITVGSGTMVQVTAATMNYVCQSITVRTATIVAITAATMAYIGQVVTVTQGGVSTAIRCFGLYIGLRM